MNPKQNHAEFQGDFWHEARYYIESRDEDSLGYLLEGESEETLNKFCSQLNTSEKEFVQAVIQKSANANRTDHTETVLRDQFSVASRPPAKQSDSDEDSNLQWMYFQKQFKPTDILYGENYAYPFLGLIQKMTTVYFQREIYVRMDIEKFSKAIHSQIQTLFSLILCPQYKKIILGRHTSQNKSIKEYLFYVFEEDYQQFIRFSHLYKNIRKTLNSKENAESDFGGNLLLESSPLTYSKNLEETRYMLSLADGLNQKDYEATTKVKSLNFAHFGREKFFKLIDPKGFLPEKSSKELTQLLSFICCRFVRKTLLEAIRKKNPSRRLQVMSPSNEALFPGITEVKIACKELIGSSRKKAQNFVHLEEPVEEVAKRTFLHQFYEFDYPSTIFPKAIMERAEEDIKKGGVGDTPSVESERVLPEKVWENNRQYRVLWTERVQAEKFVHSQSWRSLAIHSVDKSKCSQYVSYIRSHWQEFEDNCALLWIKYLSMDHFQAQESQPSQRVEVNESSGIKLQKKIKLQSLDS